MSIDIFIPPIEAFRIILRAVYPENPRLPARIKSKRYFHAAQSRYGFLPMPDGAPAHARLPHKALEILREGIRTHKVALQGCGDIVGPPKPINSADCAAGDLDVFEATLEIHDRGKTSYRYGRVSCARDHVIRLVAPIEAKYVRQVGDDDLVQEAVDGLRLKRWPNPHRAAVDLAERAQGAGTLASKVSRIETKISKHLKTSQKTPR